MPGSESEGSARESRGAGAAAGALRARSARHCPSWAAGQGSSLPCGGEILLRLTQKSPAESSGSLNPGWSWGAGSRCVPSSREGMLRGVSGLEGLTRHSTGEPGALPGRGCAGIAGDAGAGSQEVALEAWHATCPGSQSWHGTRPGSQSTICDMSQHPELACGMPRLPEHDMGHGPAPRAGMAHVPAPKTGMRHGPAPKTGMGHGPAPLCQQLPVPRVMLCAHLEQEQPQVWKPSMPRRGL